MGQPDSKPQLFLTQLSEIAPKLASLLKIHKLRLQFSITSHDVVNGYGATLTYHAFLECYVERCRYCGESQFSKPVLDCKYHRFARRWEVIADAEGLDLEETMRIIDSKIGRAQAGEDDKRSGLLRAISQAAPKDGSD